MERRHFHHERAAETTPNNISIKRFVGAQAIDNQIDKTAYLGRAVAPFAMNDVHRQIGAFIVRKHGLQLPRVEQRCHLIGEQAGQPEAMAGGFQRAIIGIADLAIYPYLALAPEGGVDLAVYPNILRWFDDIRALKGYVGMPDMWQA